MYNYSTKLKNTGGKPAFLILCTGEDLVTHKFLLKFCATPSHSPALVPTFESSRLLQNKSRRMLRIRLFFCAPGRGRILPRLNPRRRAVLSGHQLSILSTDKICFRCSNPHASEVVRSLPARIRN